MTITDHVLDLMIQMQGLQIERELARRRLEASFAAERSERVPIVVLPAANPNPNAALYHQVHAHPRGRWS